jgi:nucleoside-diphosphate-sugar epimerase
VKAHPGSFWRVIVRPPAIYGPRDTDVLEIFRMAARGLVAVPSGERWVTVAFVSDVVRSLLAAAAGGRSGGIYHVGEPEPRPLRSMVLELAEAGGLRPRVVGVPGAVVGALGLVGSLVQVAGWSRMPLTRDKARELIARHWSLETRSSLEALELGHTTALREGAIETWKWYRTKGWLQ